MRIKYLLPRCTPENSHGRYVIELVRGLHAAHEVTIYAGAIWEPLRSMARCHVLPVPTRPAILRLASLWTESLFTPRSRADEVVHVQGADAPIGDIVTAHFCNSAILALSNGASLYRRFNYWLGAGVEKYCMSKPSTRKVIAVSERVSQEIQLSYAVPAEKVIVIHNGVDAQTFHPQNRQKWRAPMRARLGIEDDGFVILFVGGDFRRKGLITLLRAARRLGSTAVVVAVGSMPDRQLQQLLTREELGKRVLFLKATSDIAPLYAMADCFALPTHYDPFSLATLEAMASGLPAVISRYAGVTEILAPATDSLLLDDPRNAEELATHLERIMIDEAYRRFLSSHARSTAERNTWDRCVEQTAQVYGELIRST